MLKKMTLIGLLIIVLAGNLLANGNDDQHKAERKLEHPLLEKVFPAVDFFITRRGNDPHDIIYMKYNNEYYRMDFPFFGFHFKDVVTQLDSLSNSTINEKIEIMARLYITAKSVKLSGNDFHEVLQKKAKGEVIFKDLNHIKDIEIKAVTDTTNVKNKNSEYIAEFSDDEHSWKLYVRFHNNKLIQAKITKDGKTTQTLCSGAIKTNREINMVITGGLQESLPTPNPPNFIYAVVSENGNDNEVVLTLDITGLPSHNTVLKIEPYDETGTLPVALCWYVKSPKILNNNFKYLLDWKVCK
jgi:hypothetical protein